MNRTQLFEHQVLPHLDAAYNLARWLLRDAQAADDAVQEASLRAFRYLDALRGDDARAWLLGIVRHACFDALARTRRQREQELEFDEQAFAEALTMLAAPVSADPQAAAQQRQTQQLIDAAIRALSPPLREVLVLRELEELDYAQIARIAQVPVGTVMSRLSRARARLRQALAGSRLGQ